MLPTIYVSLEGRSAQSMVKLLDLLDELKKNRVAVVHVDSYSTWCAVFQDAARVEHEHPVRDLDRRQPVGDDQRRPPFEQGIKGRVHRLLTLGVQRRGGLFANSKPRSRCRRTRASMYRL